MEEPKHLSSGSGALETPSRVRRCRTCHWRHSWRKQQRFAGHPLVTKATAALPAFVTPSPTSFMTGKEAVRNPQCLGSGSLPFLTSKPSCSKGKGWHWIHRGSVSHKTPTAPQFRGNWWQQQGISVISYVRVRIVLIYSQLQITSSYTPLNLSYRQIL